MPRELRGSVVVVTGAASGIGRAIAKRCAHDGARVALLDIDEQGLREVAEEIERRGGKASQQTCDIRDAAACRDAIAAVVEAWGGVDVLINNAGISHHGLFSETDLDVIRRVMDVNFFGAVNCTHAALESIVARRGAIATISSVAGFAPLLRRTGYAASKHALHGFFDSLRAELRDEGVDVVLVCPAYADTAIDRHALGNTVQHGGSPSQPATTPKKTVGKLSSPEDVAAAVVDAIQRGRANVKLSWVSKSSYWLWTLLPTAYERIMRANS
jgi:NAD(P)-dependent dehydrogenase (short-subunit alcohol dehydrogenase family)